MATEEVVSVSFEDQVKKLEDTIKKFKTLIPKKNDSENKGEQFHSFGPYNLFLEQENIKNMVQNMDKQYKRFTSTNNLNALTKLTNEKLFLSNLITPLKSTFSQAMSKIRDVAADTTLKTTILKLEAISLEEGLRFDCEQMNSNCFISCDMFYIEVMLDSSGQANDVKLHGHTGEAKSCKELIQVLREKDYKEFRSHLQGLKGRYVLKGNLVYQAKILSALEALEEDITKIMKADLSYNMVNDCIRSGPVGYVIPRDGGKNLQMTYLADPLELLDLVNQGHIKLFPLEEPLSRSVGYSAVLSVRQAPSTLLPISSLVVNENNSIHYTKQDGANSEELPATFILNLSNPLPASVLTFKLINKLLLKTDNFTHSSKASLFDLILKERLKKTKDCDWEKEEFIVELPDQVHHFNCVRYDDKSNIGLLLSCIPFTHPMQLPSLIKILRSQAMYNLLVCSCLNVCKDTNDNVEREQLKFDVIATTNSSITVTFLHPIDGSIASVDFVVSTDCFVDSHLNTVSGSPVICSNSFMNKIVNRSLSLPVTMRSVFKKAESYKPEMDKSMQTKPRDKRAIRPIKLQMPTLAQIQSEMPLMSPHLLSSPSTFLNFSPGAPLFLSDPVQKGTISKKRTPANLTPLGTPNSDGSRTPNKQKLPKITLKRKRNEDSDIYEIDQTKSEFDIDTNIPIEKPNEVNFSFNYSEKNQNQSLFAESFSNVTMEGENDMDGLLGIPAEPFSQGNPVTGNLQQSSNVPAFDLDAITSGRDVLMMESIPSSIIDPSSLVKTPNSFDIDHSDVIDIDSLMNN